MARRIYGLLGRRLGHSFSAPIHTALGCRGYRHIELEPEELATFLRRPDIGGLNVTIPYKRDVLPLCDELDDAAREIGAVNTIVNRGGKLHGCNTDKYGFEYAVRHAGLDFAGKKVVILGSGGASLSVQAASRSLGSRELVVISRSGADNYENLSRHKDAQILVNTTPVGMYPDCPAAPVSLRAFPHLQGFMDVVYNPLRTGLMLEAEALGIPHAGGLAMLVAQAKRAEELFFRKEIPDRRIDAITDKLCRDAMNLVLIGMPGSGKSTVGKLLARLSHRELIDLDKAFTKKYGATPSEIITAKGEETFRRMETACIEKVSKLSGKVITTGGGCVTREENYPLLHQNGRIYRVDRPLERLTTRGRPLSAGGIEGLRAMFERRDPLYARFADVTIQNDGTLEEAAERIWRDFNENTHY